jgi:hypothetical protein
MFDTDLLTDAARFAVLGQRIAAAVTARQPGLRRADALADVLSAVRVEGLAPDTNPFESYVMPACV